MTKSHHWDTHESLVNLLPRASKINILSGVDRYGFSSVLARLCGRHTAPRSFSNWIHGWLWTEKPTAELLACAKLPKSTTIVVGNPAEQHALKYEGFSDVRVGGLPFGYIHQQHTSKNKHALLAYPPHSAEAERITNDQSDYLDYLESLQNDFESIYVSIFYIDIDGPLQKAAERRGLRIIQGARPDDANSLLRVRAILDAFSNVTTNTMGSHMLYALHSGCKFSFCGPFYGYDESMLLANGNPHGHTIQYIRSVLELHSESFVRTKFSKFFTHHPNLGIQDVDFGRDAIGERFIMDPVSVEDALGWTLKKQLTGYLSGAIRRTSRVFRSQI